MTVKAVYFKGSGASASGGTTAVKVRLAPNKSGEASVGVMEEFSGGTGDQWRTAVWQAAIGASTFNRVALTDYEFLVRVGGHIDGPSAGMLMTSTFVAMQRGKAVKPNTTMTGTINPDGSSGPVGGIVQKMRGAAADGIKRFGFPIGEREQIDVTTGKLVDLLALSEELHIEAKELRTLGEAYEFLTGEPVTAKPRLSESDLELTVAESNAMRFIIQKIEAETTKQLDELAPLLKKTAAFDEGAYQQKTLAELSRLSEESMRALKAGSLTSAYFTKSRIKERIEVAAAFAKFWIVWRDGDVREVERQLASAGTVLNEAALLSQEIDAQFPPNFVNDLYSFDINEDTASVIILALRNEPLRRTLLEKISKLERVPTDAEERSQWFRAVQLVIRSTAEARSGLDNARRFASMYPMVKPTGAITKARPFATERSEKSLYASGTASLAYFDAIVLTSAGAQAGLSLDDAREAFAKKDSVYEDSIGLRQILEQKLGTPRLRFPVAYRLHFAAAGLSNRYYSLGAVYAEDGSATVKATKALTAQLDLAKTAMLESCAEAKQVGWIPTMARVRYLQATESREGSDNQKLAAIDAFWVGKHWCDLVATAGR